MFEVKPMINPTRLVLLCSAWLAALTQVVFGPSTHALVDFGVIGYAGFVLLTLSRLRRETILILLLLVLVGWFLLDHRPSPDEWRAAGRYVLIFTALLPTMALVRATAPTAIISKSSHGAAAIASIAQIRYSPSRQHLLMRLLMSQIQPVSMPPARHCTTKPTVLD